MRTKNKEAINPQCKDCSYYKKDFEKPKLSSCVSILWCHYYLEYQDILFKSFGYPLVPTRARAERQKAEELENERSA